MHLCFILPGSKSSPSGCNRLRFEGRKERQKVKLAGRNVTVCTREESAGAVLKTTWLLRS